MKIAVVTTMPDNAWEIYGKKMLKSFVSFWPAEIPICVQLDSDTLTQQVNKWLRPQDGLAVGWDADHAAFVTRNQGKDDPTDYRKQPVRFCHKVFAIKRALNAVEKQKALDSQFAPRYLIWMDADVITTRQVTMEEIKECLPKEGDAVSYLGRTQWPHSECGWLAFDLEKNGGEIINLLTNAYTTDAVLTMQQQDDSWVFDQVSKPFVKTNLSPKAKGLEAWPASPLIKWSQHYKGPEAKAKLANIRQEIPAGQKIIIQTKNAIPHEEIKAHIAENQKLITNWIKPCLPHDEEILIVSAGPSMIAEEVREAAKGRKVIAVKHALEPLKKAGVKVWASILLDPRPHVTNFIQEPDNTILWFVASQVDPEVTKQLLAANCKIWGYHAAVSAGEEELTRTQAYSIVSGGSATATRGLFVLNTLGFNNFHLWGYDLCFHDKPDLNERDENGNSKYLEMSVGFNDKGLGVKKCFWTEPQLIAQFEEINEIVKADKMKITAHGDGIVPFMVKAKKLADLRNRELIANMTSGKTTTYEELLWGHSINWRKWLPKNLLKRTQANNSYSS